MNRSFLIDIVKKASELTNKNFATMTKGGESDIVTNLDLEVEKFLIKEIESNYPDYTIVSEEFNSNVQESGNCFIIDPIDGTINFANNLPLWGIQVCMKSAGKSVASVIYLPRQNELFSADETGAYLNENQIQINEVPIKNALYAIDGNNNLPCMVRMRKYSSNRRSLGAVCVSMAYVASGRIHGAVFRSDKPWDYEPGLFIAKMAGAKIANKNGFHAAAMNEEFLKILETETAKLEEKNNIFVLHSLNGDTLRTWGLDLKTIYGAKEINVYLPEFSINEEFTYDKFKDILNFYLDNHTLNENTIVVCHSISNPYFIRFCFEHNFKPKAFIGVAPVGVYDYTKKEHLQYMNNLDTLKYCLYSMEDDHQKEVLNEKFIKEAKMTSFYLKGYNSFDENNRIYKIPELIELIDNLISEDV